jgi:hypothetical protein
MDCTSYKHEATIEPIPYVFDIDIDLMDIDLIDMELDKYSMITDDSSFSSNGGNDTLLLDFVPSSYDVLSGRERGVDKWEGSKSFLETVSSFSSSDGDGRLLPDDFKPSSFDVISGRGRKADQWAGNQRFRDVIAENLEEYLQATVRNEKSNLVDSVIQRIRSLSPSAGFVRGYECT